MSTCRTLRQSLPSGHAASASTDANNCTSLTHCRPEFKEWTQLLEKVVSRELTTRSEPLAFIANADTDTELWVYRNKEERDLVFAFRHELVLLLCTCISCCWEHVAFLRGQAVRILRGLQTYGLKAQELQDRFGTYSFDDPRLLCSACRGTSSPKDMITDMSVELQPFAPGEQPAQPSPEELEEDIAGNDKLAPMLEKLKDFENFGKLSGGENAVAGDASRSASRHPRVYAPPLRLVTCNARCSKCAAVTTS